jgi:hypothetical protein
MKSIHRWEFNRLLPHHRVLENLMGEPVAWFADKAKNFIGTIASAKEEGRWNFAILRRNELGNFQVCDVEENFFNLAQTMIQFRYAMVAAQNGRQPVCPSSD